MRYQKTGLVHIDRERATPGYTLFCPMHHRVACLLDIDGNIVHQWNLPDWPANYARLLPNGNLLTAHRLMGNKLPFNGIGGRIIEIDWEGNVVWEYVDPMQHHDFHRCANGNTIYLAWEKMPAALAKRVKGGRPGSELNGETWCEYIREVSPKGESVWEWHVDNLEIERYPICPICPRAAFAHGNSVYSLPNGDVMVSFRHNHLIFVIDHSSQKVKWEMCDPMLGHQHDFHVIPNGNYMVFANGAHAFGPGTVPGGAGGSRVLEIEPASRKIVWEYFARPGYLFSSPYISGAERLPTGNTLICEGSWGNIFEVTPGREIVWEYINPFVVPLSATRDIAGSHQVFRAYRYGADSPEIRGRVRA